MEYNDIKARCKNAVYKAEKNCFIVINQKANTFICSNGGATYTNTDTKEMFILAKGDILYSSEKEVEILKVVDVNIMNIMKDGNNDR